MSKYHVKVNGDVGICRAQDGNCPFTVEGAEHFNKLENAMKFSEKIIEDTVGGTFSNTSLKKTQLSSDKEMPLNYREIDYLPEKVKNPANYTIPWEEGAYLYQNIEEDDTFVYDNKIYRYRSSQWDRSNLNTKIEATNLNSGDKEFLNISQDNESDIKFLPKGGQKFLREGKDFVITDGENSLNFRNLDTYVVERDDYERYGRHTIEYDTPHLSAVKDLSKFTDPVIVQGDLSDKYVDARNAKFYEEDTYSFDPYSYDDPETESIFDN